MIECDAFIFVIGNLPVQHHRSLIERQKTLFLASNTVARHGVQMQYAGGVFTRTMNGTMNGESGRVHFIRCLLNYIAVHVYFHQARSGNFVKEQSKRIDQKMMLSSGHAGRNVRKDQVIPSEVCYQSVSSSEVNPDLPFLS